MARPTRQARHPALRLRGRTTKHEEYLCVREEPRQIKDYGIWCSDQERPPVRPVRVVDQICDTFVLHGSSQPSGNPDIAKQQHRRH
jgi:hypothetical protein